MRDNIIDRILALSDDQVEELLALLRRLEEANKTKVLHQTSA